jgi:hypothetical protein
LGVKAGVLVHPCRLAVTGKTSGLSLYHPLQVLGKERLMARIDKALATFAGKNILPRAHAGVTWPHDEHRRRN